MRILVTGADGFVGSRTCHQLESSGNEVVRVRHRYAATEPSGSDYAVDISDPSSIEQLRSIGTVDAAVHCAGIAHRFGETSGDDFRKVNVEGAKNIAELAVDLRVEHFVHVSSVMVYGPGSGAIPLDENQPPSPGDPYSSSKLEGESAVEAVLVGTRVKRTILRPAPIVGEGSRGNVSRLIRAIDSGWFRWIGDGKNLRSFVYVGDVARSIEFALTLTDERSVFNVVGGDVTVSELVNIIAKRLDKEVGGFRVPGIFAGFGLAVTKPFDRVWALNRYRRTLETWMADAVYSGKAIKARGFEPVTTIEEALRLEVDRYLENR